MEICIYEVTQAELSKLSSATESDRDLNFLIASTSFFLSSLLTVSSATSLKAETAWYGLIWASGLLSLYFASRWLPRRNDRQQIVKDIESTVERISVDG